MDKSFVQIESEFINDSQLHRNVDICVIATMSAGKSTLINAMLGTDLLPSANEATTATIAQITDNDEKTIGQFSGERIDKEGNIVDKQDNVNLATLKEWNSQKDTKLIKLNGNIVGIKERENVRLVLTDTPGPNNSQDPEHQQITLSYIQDSQRNPLILYILNGTQLGTDDDKRLLGIISEEMQKKGKQSKDRFIFIVNKMDSFDPEKGEHISDVLDNVKNYLKNNGIENPQVYPISANLARLLRIRESGVELSRKERGDLTAMEELFTEEDEMDLTQYMPLTEIEREELAKKNIPFTLMKSGIPVIELMIDKYINKYNFPHRINIAYITLKSLINLEKSKENATVDLAEHKSNLDNIRAQIQRLDENRDININAKVKIDLLIHDKEFLYDKESMKELDKIEAKSRKSLQSLRELFFGKNSNSKMKKSEAERKLEEILQQFQFDASVLLNNYERVFLDSQERTKIKLTQVFNEYVKDILVGVELPKLVLDGLTTQILNIGQNVNLGLNENEVDTQDKEIWVGTKQEAYEVAINKLTLNPISWFKWFFGPHSETRYRNVDVYETVTEEVVDAEEIWGNREEHLRNYYNDLTSAASKKFKQDIEKYAKSFSSFIRSEFDIKLAEVFENFNKTLENKETVELAVAESEKILEEIKRFEQTLNEVLEL